MFGLFKRKSSSTPSDLSQLEVAHIDSLLKRMPQDEVMKTCQQAAEAGSVDAAVFLSTAFLHQASKQGPHQALFQTQFLRYTEIAAKLGDSGSQFNLGKHYLSLCQHDDDEMSVEGYEALKKAEHWYQLAAAQGLPAAVSAMNNLRALFDWAHNAFSDDAPEDEGGAFAADEPNREASSDQGRLIDVVPRVSKTGYVFWDINDDMGHAANAIMGSSPLVKMAYGYARRASMAALHIQGLVSADHYAHAVSIFKSLQVQTGTTVDFQERAARHSEEFMQTYSHQITGLFVKKLIALSAGYEATGERMPDGQLFAEVVDALYAEQEAWRTGVN